MVILVNVSLKLGTITDGDGIFRIPVRVGDTLHISAIPFISKEVIINETIWRSGKISLYMEPKITELDEVVISTIDLTGDLLKDISSVKIEKIYVDPRDLGLPLNTRPVMTTEERRYYAAKGGAGALGSLINAISGRTKMLKKHLEVSRLVAKINVNRFRFSDTLYMKELKIPEEHIEDFVYYVFEDQEVVRNIENEDIFKILEMFKQKAPEYIELKKAEDLHFKNR